MRNAKIMLTTIILLSIVGGALAFKAKSFGSNITLFVYTSSNTVAVYTAIGQPGCFKPTPLFNATAGGGVQYNASTTTFLTYEADFCTTLTSQRNDE